MDFGINDLQNTSRSEVSTSAVNRFSSMFIFVISKWSNRFQFTLEKMNNLFGIYKNRATALNQKSNHGDSNSVMTYRFTSCLVTFFHLNSQTLNKYKPYAKPSTTTTKGKRLTTHILQLCKFLFHFVDMVVDYSWTCHFKFKLTNNSSPTALMKNLILEWFTFMVTF